MPAKPEPPPIDEVTDATPYLETVSRVDEQLEYVLAREQIVVGTAHGNDIVIDSMFAGWATVSPVHAELRREQNSFVLVDRGSEAGTFVNDERITNVALSDGDRLRIGDVQFIFRAPSESSGDQV
jgi:pSer/pThr/pTyr-binding forkhead associated (FHA) protein